ncbi:unnamed protein product [Rotaria magnacalcarata]|uniref:Cullin family profile domain-containing protein n=2 Tax=Rotaria magnacalcarata TaxID=392030 RepID=A0A814ZYQ9_9BILA|nr:unnamed protein product [Rotaria magnacalcarata]
MKDCTVHQTNKTLNLIDTIPINDPKTYIQIVISIDNEYSKPIQDSFDANSNLTVVHDTVTQSVQVSARYSENRIVLKFIGDKDVYEKFYGKMLAKRLVAQSSTSEDCKQLMISKLRAVCGFPFTSKLERMLQDNDASKNLTHEYRAYCKEKDVEDMVGFSVMVLNSTVWSFSTPSNVILSIGLKSRVDSFTGFYTDRQSGRKLIWLP